MINKKAPNFAVQNDMDETVKLSDFKGKKLVLYFYPKDNTPGCTTESKDFTANYKAFQKLNTEILGISADSVTKHKNFKAKYDMPFMLLADTEHAMCEAYEVWKEKSMFGKKYMGIERSTFLIDENGKIQKIWRKVKVKGHVEEVLASIKEL